MPLVSRPRPQSLLVEVAAHAHSHSQTTLSRKSGHRVARHRPGIFRALRRRQRRSAVRAVFVQLLSQLISLRRSENVHSFFIRELGQSLRVHRALPRVFHLERLSRVAGVGSRSAGLEQASLSAKTPCLKVCVLPLDIAGIRFWSDQSSSILL